MTREELEIIFPDERENDIEERVDEFMDGEWV